MATASMSDDLPGTIEKEYYARFFGNLAHHQPVELAAIDHAHHRGYDAAQKTFVSEQVAVRGDGHPPKVGERTRALRVGHKWPRLALRRTNTPGRAGPGCPADAYGHPVRGGGGI